MELDLAQLRALRAAVDEGTLEAAAGVLHVTPSAVSQRIKALEVATGHVLLVRSRPIRATPAGRTLLRLARQVDLLTDEALHELAAVPDDDLVPFSMAVNADSLGSWLLPALGELRHELVFDLHREDEERTADLLRAGVVAAAVTAAAEPVAGCTSTPLGSMRYRPAATPTFVRTWFPDGVTADALARAPVVHFDRQDDLQRRWLRERLDDRPMPPGHHVPSTDGFERAVLAGFGWGMLSDVQLAGLASGSAVLLDERSVVEVPLYWQRWKLRSAALERVSEVVITAARAALEPPTPG